MNPPVTVRAQSIPARHYCAKHAHSWHQVVYAISGVLTVAVEGRSFAISPEQAVWPPTGLPHRVGSLLGAEFRSLWIADEAGAGPADEPDGLRRLAAAAGPDRRGRGGRGGQDLTATRAAFLPA